MVTSEGQSLGQERNGHVPGTVPRTCPAKRTYELEVRRRSRELRAMALLELFPRPAPARIVAADLVAIRRDDLPRHRRRGAPGPERPGPPRPDARGRNRICTRGSLVRVRETPVLLLTPLRLLEHCRIGRRDLRVEQREDD